MADDATEQLERNQLLKAADLCTAYKSKAKPHGALCLGMQQLRPAAAKPQLSSLSNGEVCLESPDVPLGF